MRKEFSKSKEAMLNPSCLGILDRQKAQQLLTVHLVEDSVDDLLFARHLLVSSTYVKDIVSHSSATELLRYLEAEGAYEAEEDLQENAIILLDVHLPDMNGIEALQHIRMHPLTEEMSVILLTGDTSTDLAFDAYQNRATAFLQKPLRLDHFHEVLNRSAGQKMTSR